MRSKRVLDDMRWIGVAFWLTGSVRLFRDGGGYSYVFRAWHPITWLAILAMIVPCALLGAPLREVVPLRLSAYWAQRRAHIQWVSPWSRAQP